MREVRRERGIVLPLPSTGRQQPAHTRTASSMVAVAAMRRSVDEHGSALQSWRERARAHEVRSAGPVSSWPSDWERWREGDREGRRRERFAETVTHMPPSGAQRSGGDGDGDAINLRNSTRITIKSLTESLHRTARSLEASEASFTEEPSCRPRRTETGERAGESVAEGEAARLKLRFSISLHSADKAEVRRALELYEGDGPGGRVGGNMRALKLESFLLASKQVVSPNHDVLQT